MAKKPSAPKKGAIPAEIAPGSPKSGESPQKASPIPADAVLSESFAEPQGEGGETHQTAEGDVAVLTTQQGVPVADDQNSLKQGTRGPVLLEDPHFRKKSSTSTMSASQSAWSTPAAMVRTAFSSSRIAWRT